MSSMTFIFSDDNFLLLLVTGVSVSVTLILYNFLLQRNTLIAVLFKTVMIFTVRLTGRAKDKSSAKFCDQVWDVRFRRTSIFRVREEGWRLFTILPYELKQHVCMRSTTGLIIIIIVINQCYKLTTKLTWNSSRTKYASTVYWTPSCSSRGLFLR